MFLKIVRTMKAHIQSNLKVPHPTLVALGINVAITVVIVGIFYIADTGMMGIGDAEAARKLMPKDGGR